MGPVETDDNPLAPFVAKLKTLVGRTFTAEALRPKGVESANMKRICADLQAFGLIDATGRGRWRVNAEKLNEAFDYLHLRAVVGGPVTDEVFDALVAQGRLLAVTEEEQPLYALNADQSGRKN
jgi:hypothetical protein